MNSTPEQLIKAQYIALAKLLKTYRDKPLDKSTLQSTLDYCKNLHALAQAQSNLVFAQPQLYKPQLPLVVNLAFNACVFTCLVAVRNKFDPAMTIQLMCASISIFACDQTEIEKYYQKELNNEPPKLGQNATQMRTLLRHHQQHIWLLASKLSSAVHSQKAMPINRLQPASALIYFAIRLSILCTPNKLNKALSFAQGLKSLIQSSPAKFYSLLSPLLAYPGLTPPGAYLKDKDSIIRIVLAIYPEGLLTKEIMTKQQNLVTNKPTEIMLVKQEKLAKSYTSQTLKGFSQLNHWWNNELATWMTNETNQTCIEASHKFLPVNAAPPALLVIQDQLKQSHTDISLLVKAIEKEPSYAQQLQVSASLGNRQRQAVKNIQQGLAMLGTERTASIFLQHSLLSRLNQHYFPLQQTFLAFSQFFVFLVEDIAVLTKSSSINMLKTTAYFLLSRLFTLPNLRAQLVWNTNPQCSFQVNSLITLSQSVDLQQDAVLLAQAWQQSPAIIQLLQTYDQHANISDTEDADETNGYLLGLALIMAKQSYFPQSNQCEATEKYLGIALETLNISEIQWADLHKKLMIKAQISCQIF